VDNQRARTAALLLGVGLGGFIDGIVLDAHWHQMRWFHLAMWIVTLAGVLVLRSAVRGAGPIPSTRGFVGYLLIGWGAFNLVEGIALYSWLFLLIGGVGLIVLGFVLRDRLPASARVEAERRSGVDRRLNAR
jgi:uncharacterized membrane protein